MKIKFLPTRCVRKAVEAATALRNQGEGLPCLGAWHAPAGRGKTKASIWYAATKGGNCLLPKVGSSQLSLLCDLYAELKGQSSAHFYRVKDAYEACLRLMWDRQEPILIDEADRIVNRAVLVETIRDLSDRTNCPVIFVGTDQMLVRLMQREQVASRLAQVVAFEALTVEEVTMIAAELCGLELGKETAQVLHKASQGYFRDLVVALAHVERAVAANKLKELPADMAAEVARKAIKRAA